MKTVKTALYRDAVADLIALTSEIKAAYDADDRQDLKREINNLRGAADRFIRALVSEETTA